jgi:hypothetical protein
MPNALSAVAATASSRMNLSPFASYTSRRNVPSPVAASPAARVLPAGQLLPAGKVYSSLVNTYRGRVSEATKGEILTSLNATFDAYLRSNRRSDINALKKMLDVSFSKDVDCKYKYIFASTPNSYGCDLRELIFNRDGTTTSEGNALLQTFQAIASAYTAAEIPKLYHVLTDIDDTLYANRWYRTYIAGSDMSWPEHIAYPGVKEMHRQLHSLDNSTKYSTVLSATPGAAKTKKMNSQELKDMLGGTDFSFIQGIEGKRDILRNAPSTLLTGFFYRGNNPDGAFYRTIAETKYARFQQYARIFPERQYIWIGDNGQGDEVAGRRMLDQPDVTVTVCIHIVRPAAESARDPRIIYFNTYGELATKLFDRGILGRTHVAAIIKSMRHECMSTSGTSASQRAIHCDDLPTRGDMKRMQWSRRTGIREGGGRRRKRKTLKQKQQQQQQQQQQRPRQRQRRRQSVKYE